jgi:caffeoyl-CoA O-methyltransferase
MTPLSAAVRAARPVTPVGILAELLERIDDQLDATEGVDAGWRHELRRARDLACGLDPYLTACTTPESPALRLLAERTQAEDWSAHAAIDAPAPLEQEMLSGHVEGQVLKFLVAATRAQRVLDIGMFTGYSALAMAEALPDHGSVVACEIDAGVAAFAQRCFAESPSGPKVEVRVGPALASLEHMAVAGETFDLVFLDADKIGYVSYLASLLDHGLVAPGGVICVDNTLLQGQPYVSGDRTVYGAAIADFNRYVAGDRRIEQVLIPLRDGLTLIRRTDGC